MTTLDTALELPQVWTAQGWQADAGLAVTVSDSGAWVLPGIANLHSHAFQRAMAGLAEYQTHAQDSFWTWRETMYRFAARMTPESTYAVATQLYAEMLEAGYTSVCEFHYLHHQADGRAYADPATMSRALIAAARDTGIRMTLLPVLYMTGGFDGRPLNARQQRFGHGVEAFLRLLETLRAGQDDRLRIGCAFHSLRAVPEAAMREVLSALPGDMPVHIHIAEKIGEVQDCVSLLGARPVEWLLQRFAIDARWTLVHATHLTPAEIRRVVNSGATVAICPSTEANLGDGLFPLRAYLDAGGAWGIGSDSHISVSPVEELRWLEYGQRLATRQRNIAVSRDTGSVGQTLLRGVQASAAQATGQQACADYVVLDTDAAIFAGMRPNDVIDRWVFSGNRNAVREVHVGGQRVVAEGRHRDHEAIGRRYRQTVAALLSD